jgi:DNA-binding CsgD family transcriptional regulator
MSGSGNHWRRSKDRDRDERVLALLKAGATTQQVRDSLGCSGASAFHLCTRLRREYGIVSNDIAPSADLLAKPRAERKLTAPREMLGQFREVCKHLGKEWVADFVGRDAGKLDEDQVVDVMQLHAALLFVLNDGQQVLLDVRERLSELERLRMAHTAQGTVSP